MAFTIDFDKIKARFKKRNDERKEYFKEKKKLIAELNDQIDLENQDNGVYVEKVEYEPSDTIFGLPDYEPTGGVSITTSFASDISNSIDEKSKSISIVHNLNLIKSVDANIALGDEITVNATKSVDDAKDIYDETTGSGKLVHTGYDLNGDKVYDLPFMDKDINNNPVNKDGSAKGLITLMNDGYQASHDVTNKMLATMNANLMLQVSHNNNMLQIEQDKRDALQGLQKHHEGLMSNPDYVSSLHNADTVATLGYVGGEVETLGTKITQSSESNASVISLLGKEIMPNERKNYYVHGAIIKENYINPLDNCTTIDGDDLDIVGKSPMDVKNDLINARARNEADKSQFSLEFVNELLSGQPKLMEAVDSIGGFLETIVNGVSIDNLSEFFTPNSLMGDGSGEKGKQGLADMKAQLIADGVLNEDGTVNTLSGATGTEVTV